MWFLKKNLLGLALVVGAVCSSFAADVGPFVFGGKIGSDHDAQQAAWESLMKYKMFGQVGINFAGQEISIPDQSGFFGTATGDFTLVNLKHHVGGPILIGGNISFADGSDTISSGPVRVLGNITAGNFGGTNIINGNQCVRGSVSSKYSNVTDDAKEFFGNKYASCPTSVPQVDTALLIPSVSASIKYDLEMGALNTNGGTLYIDVPPADTPGEPYDIHVSSITMPNESRLVIRMPHNGRLTRIFLDDGFVFGPHPKIQTANMDRNATYNYSSHRWSGSETIVENKGYAGNLLFYTSKDIAWPAVNATDTIQGTFISSGTISIQQHMTLAGQLLANYITINAQFDGSGYIYIPFDPPLIDLADVVHALKEGLADDPSYDGEELDIHLDKAPETNISFKYCFLFPGETDPGPRKASISDVDMGGHSTQMPICDVDEPITVVIPAGSLYPSSSVKVWVASDALEEEMESFQMKIYNLVGSVFKYDQKQIILPIYIEDDDKSGPPNNPPTAKGFTVHIPENFPVGSAICNGNDCGLIDALQAVDPEGGVLSFDITANNIKNTFKIEGGELRLNRALDYENDDYVVYPLSITVSDPNGGYKVVNVTVYIDDVNERPTAQAFVASIPENSQKNVLVGKITASDLETPFSSLSFKILSGNSDAVLSDVFTIVNGHIFVNKEFVDYERKKQYKMNVLVCDDGRTDTKAASLADTLCVKTTATINITNVLEEPVAQNITCSIKENSTTFVGSCKVSGTDSDGSAISSFELRFDSDMFGVNESTGAITVKQAPDYEASKQHKIYVNLKGSEGTKGVEVTINVIDVNEDPVVTVTDAHVMENSREATDVVAVIASDEEDGYNLDYKILSGSRGGVAVDTADLPFVIVTGENGGDDGIIRTRGNIDYESFADTTKSYYDITVQVCDKGTFDGTPKTPKCKVESLRIKVDDGPEPPTVTGFAISVRENAPEDSVLGTVTGTDPEGGAITYSFISGNKAYFAIDADGTVKVLKGVDFESLPAGANPFIYVAKGLDADLLSDTALVTITILDINEGPKVDDATMTVPENKPVGTTVDTLELEDPDTKPENRQNKFEAVGGDTAFFSIDSITGEIKTKAVFDYEAKTSYSLVVRVYDQDGNEDTATVTIKIADEKENSNIVITYAVTESGAQDWDYPTGTIYTNESTVNLQWTADGKQMPDTLLTNLHEGLNLITLTYTDPTKNKGVTETIGIYVSTRTPEVTVTTSAKPTTGANIYTLVETVDESDTSVYVNKKNNDIVITIKDPVIDATYSDSTCNYETYSFTVNTELDPVTIPSSTYDVVNKVTAAAPVLNSNPASEVTYSQYNNDQVKVSYTEKVAGVDVTISYVTDKNGNVEKIPVIGVNGKIDSIEVITVSYQVNVGGKVVNVSYVADAITGQALKTTTVNNNNSGSNSASNSGSNGGANGGSNSGSNGGSGSNSGTGNSAPVYMYSLTDGEVLYTVTYDFKTKAKGMGETTVQVSYTVDQKGNVTKDKDGNVGYEVSYTYVNEMGNSSTQSVYIVVDLIPPKVKIETPHNDDVLHSNMVEVKWCVDLGDGLGCQPQDSLTVEGLQPGQVNEIVRFYRDKAGNEASDVVYVMAKNTKDVDISVEKPVTVITKDDVEKYYASKEPENGQTFSISIYNPQTQKEIETQVGGKFKNKPAAHDSVYPNLPGHLGPTLGIQAKVPVINSVDGLATLDDLVGSDGLILLDAVDAVGSRKVTVDEYVKHCNADFRAELGSDISKANLYDTKMIAKIWVYTSLGQFVDYFSFTQELNDPSYASDAGVLNMYFEMKPDKNGDLHTENGRLYATGAYVYKTEITMKSELRCDLPPFDDASNANKMGQKKRVKEDLLKSFGYKRPTSK